MAKLIIRQSGHFIDVEGMPSFRTPAKVNIPESAINKVVVHLAKLGIEDYDIIAHGYFKVHGKIVKEEINKKKEKVITVDIEGVNKRLSKIESLLASLLGRAPEGLGKVESLLHQLLIREPKVIERVIVKGEEVVKDELEELEETFIPDVDIEGLKVKGKVTFKTERREDVSKTVKELQKMEENKTKT